MTAIDRSTMVACDDPVFRSAVQATGKNRVAASAPFTQTCLAYTCVELLAGGCQMGFVEDAVGDTSQQEHDIAARRLTQAGAFPYTTRAITNEWWRGDFTSGSAAVALELYGKYFAEIEAVTGRRRCSGGARARQPRSRPQTCWAHVVRRDQGCPDASPAARRPRRFRPLPTTKPGAAAAAAQPNAGTATSRRTP